MDNNYTFDLANSISINPSGIKVVLGNGFDLFCGLNTRYRDFFNSEKGRYKKIKDWYDSFKDIKGFIEQKSVNWNDFGPREQLDNDVNAWDIYFALGIGEKDYDWCNIESEILKTFENKSGNFHWEYVHFIIINNKVTNPFILNLEYKLAAYIIYKNLDISTKEKYYMYLLDELKMFEKHFGAFVNNEYEAKYEIYRIKASKFFKSFSYKFGDEISSKETFNYTNNSVMRKNKSSNFLDDIIHINGDFNNPIFGVDSSELSVDNPNFIFTKVSRRLINAALIDKSIDSSFSEGFNTLLVFGHSLNKQDYNYFFPIFDYLDIINITKDSTIIFAYHIYDEKRKEEIIIDYIKRVTQLIDAYERYAGKNKDNRLIDSLTIQGRIKLLEIKK